MIIEKKGNVLDVPNGVIVQGCNSHGVMGSGLAKEVRERFPLAYKVYREAHDAAINQGLPGLRLGTFTTYDDTSSKTIVNAITQKDFGRDPSIVYVDYIALGQVFESITDPRGYLYAIAKEHGLHFPLIGCGLANGQWGIVSGLIDALVPPEIEKTLWIYQP